LVFTASLHFKRDSVDCENRPTSSSVAPLGKALIEIISTFEWLVSLVVTEEGQLDATDLTPRTS